jgi:hypothetical protein
MSTKHRVRPQYFQTLHSRYYRLPKVLWDYIWMFDDRYRIQFKECTLDLDRYFNHNRLMDRLAGEIHLYNVYLSMNHSPIYNIAQYILTKIKRFGDLIVNDNLKYLSLCKHLEITCKLDSLQN